MTGEAMERKQRRNLDLLQKLIDQEGGSGYHYFQMGQSYFVLGDMDSAISAYEKGLGMADSAEHVYVPELIMSLANTYADAGRSTIRRSSRMSTRTCCGRTAGSSRR